MMKKNNNHINIFKYISLFLIFLYTMYYYFSRGYVPIIKDYLMAGDETIKPINASQFSEISSAFSLTYSLFQVIGGFALDKIGIRFLYPILGIYASIMTYVFAGYTEHNTAVYIRYLLGIFFSIASTGAYKYFSIFWNDKFNLLSNVTPVLMCGAAGFAGSMMLKNVVANLGWRNFLKLYGKLGLFLSLGLLIIFLILFSLYNPVKKEENICNDNKNNESVSIIEGIKEVFLLPGFIPVGIFAIASSSAAYVLMDGWGDTLYGLKYPGVIPFMTTTSMNMAGNAIGYAYNIFADKISIKKQMLIYSILGFVPLILILYVNICANTFLICCFFLGFVCASQNIGFLFLQKNLSIKYLGLGFGILNFLCMFFGCALVQKFTGIVLDIIKNKNILNGMAPYVSYKYADLLSTFKFLLIPSVLALIAVIVFKEKKK